MQCEEEEIKEVQWVVIMLNSIVENQALPS